MRRIDIVAPVSGTVLNLAVHTKGGVIAPGAAIMEIVPNNDALVLEVQISPLDIDSIHVNDQVAIHISAVDTRLTPVIYGTLETISADRITDQRTGNSFYKGRVTISKEQLDRLGEHKLHSGMAVEAMVQRGEQSVLHYLLKPLIDSLTRSFKEK
jgi:HlyD family secretion protein